MDALALPATWRIKCGDVLDVLRRVPDRSVHCCVTSPPYWGLRDYGIDPSIWGGDPACEHEYEDERVPTEKGRGNWSQATNGRGEVQGDVAEYREPLRSAAVRGFCRKCSAWRGCFGLEPTLQLFIAHAVEIFREVRRVLRDDGTLWLNIGDSYNAYNGNAGPGSGFSRGAACGTQRPNLASGHGLRAKGLKPKDLVGIPWMLAFALRDDGWYLRSEIIWHKKSPMPESVSDRPTKAHEQIFLLTKSPRYFYDAVGGAEKAVGGQSGNVQHKYEAAYKAGDERHRTKAGLCNTTAVATRNARSVWTLSNEPFGGAHFATFPTELPRRCLLAGTSERGCCPECGAPLVRATKKERVATRTGAASKVHGVKSITDRAHHDPAVVGNRDPERHVTHTVTTGWKPSCQHSFKPSATVPCLVLDPFNGAGTTGMVARRMGLRYIGIERSPSNVAMSIERITSDMPLFNS